MTSKPPVPTENKSPYPVEKGEDPQAPSGEALAAAREAKDARNRSISARTLGIGAAIGIGSAAIVAALLYSRSGRKGGRD